MSEINWGFVQEGHKFEALVATLIRHKNPQARIYERPGPDAGMDAKSKDGQTVYQAKYISSQSNFSQLLGTLKKEIDKIKRYKNSNHKNYKYWKNVTKWVLCTNAAFNPQDEEKWKNQVEQPLKDMGISASLKHKADIEQSLRDYPDVKNEFFDGKNRVLLSLSEAKAKGVFTDDKILAIGLRTSFEGRSKELNTFMEFIKEGNHKKVINIHGPGGVGKTRFVMEAALKANNDEGYDIFWANTATMESNNNWFQDITTGRKSLLVIDEPTEKKSIKMLLEQIQSTKLSRWKCVVIARTVKEPVLGLLNHHLLKSIAKPIEIEPLLNREESKKVFLAFLDSSEKLKNRLSGEEKRKLLRYISQASGGFPIWMAVVVYFLEKGYDLNGLPRDISGLAKKYIEEFLSSPPQFIKKEVFCEYLKAIAVLQPVNIEDDPKMHEYFQTLLGDDMDESKLAAVFDHLQNTKLASKRGRLLEIKPDVIRDHIIFKYVGCNVFESKKWLNKIFQLKDSYKMKSALVQLAKLAAYERYKENQSNNFFDTVWEIFVTEVKNGDVEKQYNILELASAVSFVHPVKFLEVVKTIRDNKKEKKAFENTNIYISHDDLIIKLPEAVYDAGRYVVSDEEARQIFKELLVLFRMEHSITDPKARFLQDKEKKSETYIKNLMKLDNQELRYKKIILEWVKNQLNSIHQATDENTLKLLKSIVEDFSTVKRDRFETEDWKFVISLDVIPPESEDQEYINQIMAIIWKQLNKSNTDSKKRVLLWQLISFYQNQICHAEKVPLKEDQEKYSFWKQETEKIFQNVKKYISTHNLHISEIKPLKSIWDWHLGYDKRQDIKNLALECENLILTNNTYQDMKPLFEGPHYYPEEGLIKKYVDKNNSPDKLRSFVNNCFHYVEPNRYQDGFHQNAALNRCQDIFHQVAGVLVRNTNQIPPYALDYINKILKEKKDDYHFQFVCRILFHQAGVLREQKKNKLSVFLHKYWSQLKSKKQKGLFLRIVFSQAHPVVQGLLTKQDIEFMSEILNSDGTLSLDSLYLIGGFAGRVVFSDFTQSKKLILNLFKKKEIKPKNTFALFENYAEGVNHRFIFKEKYPVPQTKNIFLWLMELLSSKVFSEEFMDDIEILENNRIQQQLNARFFITDYVCFLKKRLSLFEEKTQEKKFLWNNPLLKDNFLKMVEPVNRKDKDTQDALNTLLDFNGSDILHYSLPRMVKMFDPEGIYIPNMVVERIKNKEFLCKNLKDDIPAEYEWTRYAGSYSVNSEPWRQIALVACQIASQKPQKEKEFIFRFLMNYGTKFYKGRPDEVLQFLYSDIKDAENDFQNEKDEGIREFMKWRLGVCKGRLKSEKQWIAERDRDFN